MRMLPPGPSGAHGLPAGTGAFLNARQQSGVSSIGDGTPLTTAQLPSRGGLFQDPFFLPDIHFRCDDNTMIPAHKHVLGQRCRYYYDKLCKRQPRCVVNSDHTAVIKEYGFRGSSACCRAMLQFFYMGYILELEDPEVAIEPHQQQISELLEFSLIRGREGLGGLAEYLVKKLSTKGLMDASTAVQRLALAMSLATSVGPDVRIQVLIDAMKNTLPGLSFTPDAFSRGLVDPDTVELILRDVPLPADEVDVCRALSKWAEAYFGDPDTSGDFAGHIPVLPNLHIFSNEYLANAKRCHVLTQSRDPQLYKGLGCRNTSRGSDMSTGRTRVKSPTSAPSQAGGSPVHAVSYVDVGHSTLPHPGHGTLPTQPSQASDDMDAHPRG